MNLLVGKDDRLFCYIHYDLGDINEFIKGLNDIKKNITTLSSIKDKDYEKIAGITCAKFSLINQVLCSKKMEKRPQDLSYLGKCVQEIGKELEEFGQTHKSYSNKAEDVKKSSDAEIIEKILSDIKELMKD